jgi:hypothetical protein
LTGTVTMNAITRLTTRLHQKSPRVVLVLVSVLSVIAGVAAVTAIGSTSGYGPGTMTGAGGHGGV